jgi:hypothetical protein
MTSAPTGRDSTWSEAGPVSCGLSSTWAGGGTACLGAARAGRGAGAGPRGSSAPGGPDGVGPTGGAGTISSGWSRTGSGTDDSVNGCPCDPDPEVGAGFSTVAGTPGETWLARYPLAKPITMPSTSDPAAANQMPNPLLRRGSSMVDAKIVGSAYAIRGASSCRAPASTTAVAYGVSVDSGASGVSRMDAPVRAESVSRNGKSTSGSSCGESGPCSGGPFAEALRS